MMLSAASARAVDYVKSLNDIFQSRFTDAPAARCARNPARALPRFLHKRRCKAATLLVTQSVGCSLSYFCGLNPFITKATDLWSRTGQEEQCHGALSDDIHLGCASWHASISS